MTIRVVPSAADPVVRSLAQLMSDAYPVIGITSVEGFERFVERLRARFDEGGTRYVVAERDGAAVGAMALYDFAMNVRGRDAAAGGVGSVAVSLAHKRQGIARDLIAWYLADAHARSATFAILHAFRPNFYRTLGFGYGTPMHRYRFAPSTLRAQGARGVVRLLGPADLDALLACSERVRATTNGLIAKVPAHAANALADPALRFAGVEHDGVLRGFMQTSVILGPKDSMNRNALLVRELAYEDPASLAALLAYLRSQSDQFAEIVIESQDAALYLASDDPRDRTDRTVAPPGAHRIADTGLGLMYRTLDMVRAFAHLPPAAAAFTLAVVVDDPFFAPTSGTWTFRFTPDDAPRPVGAAPDATLRAGIPEISALLVGSLRLRDCVRHRLASVEPASALERVARAFHADDPPVCTTRF